MKLVVRVVEIKGSCPVYKVGDEFTIADGYRLDTAVSCPHICMHSLASLLPYYNALRFKPGRDFGLAKEGDRAYLQCLDPFEHTGGGTAVFEVRREE